MRRQQLRFPILSEMIEKRARTRKYRKRLLNN
jgi:hypothetical protein